MATGKYAFAICDRCGFKYKHRELRLERDTKLRVCRKCLDKPIPLPKTPPADKPLPWTRPDVIFEPVDQYEYPWEKNK